MDFIPSPTAGIEEDAPGAPYVPTGEGGGGIIGGVTAGLESAGANAFEDLQNVNTYLDKVRAEQGGIRHGVWVPPEPFLDAKTNQANHPGVKGLDEPMPASVAQGIADTQKRHEIQASAAARYPSGAVPFLSGLGANTIAGMLDPVDQAAFMIPVVGEARYATWLARAGEASGLLGRAGVTLAVGGVRGLAGGAALETGKYASGVDPDMTMGDIAKDTLDMGWQGALFHGALAFRGDILGRRFVHEFVDDAVARGRQLKADEFDAAARAAAGQMADWQPVEVRPVLGQGENAYRASLMGGTAATAPMEGIPPDRGPQPPARARGAKIAGVDKDTGKPILESEATPTTTPSDLLDNAVARANGAPSTDDVRLENEAQEAARTPPSKVEAGAMEEERQAVEEMRQNGDLDPEELAVLRQIEEQNVSQSNKGEEGGPAKATTAPPATPQEGIGAETGRAPPEGERGGFRTNPFRIRDEHEQDIERLETEGLASGANAGKGGTGPEPTEEEIAAATAKLEEQRRARDAAQKPAEQPPAPVGEPPVGTKLEGLAKRMDAEDKLRSGQWIEGRGGELIKVEHTAVSDAWTVKTWDRAGGGGTLVEGAVGTSKWSRDEAVNHALKLAGVPVEEPAPQAQNQPTEEETSGAQGEPGGVRGEGVEAPGTVQAEAGGGGEEGRDVSGAGREPLGGDRGLDQQPGTRPEEPRASKPSATGERADVAPPPHGERRDEGNVAAGRGEREIDRPFGRVRGSNFRLDRRELEQNYAGSAGMRAGANMAAIDTLNAIPEDALPTHDQQIAISRYVGWGGIPQIFDEAKAAWAKQRARLKELLTPEEFEQARASTINAHYTSPDVVEAMWHALGRLGFDGDGTVLEPGMGIGNFLGLRPEGVEPKFTGVELDTITGRLARALYPDARIHIDGFENVRLPPNSFDAVIGNVPFGKINPFDKEYNPDRSLTLHNYFIAKSTALMKPGGVMAVITTHYTMDAHSAEAREAIHRAGADLVGAIRLPNTAFGKNANTEVTTDILFFRKRMEGEAPADATWLRASNQPIGEGHALINDYFAAHPEDVLGEHALTGTMYRDNEYTVTGSSERLGERIKERAEAIAERAEHAFSAEAGGETPEILPPENSEGSFFEHGGKIMQNTAAGPVEADIPKDATAQVGAMIRMRDLAREVLGLQKQEWPGEGTAPWADAQERLNKEYDAFVEKYGPINKSVPYERKMASGEVRPYRRYPNMRHFRDDPDAYLVAALENYDEDTGKASKAAIMYDRVVEPTREITHADSPEDALAASMNVRGGVDMPYMSKLLGKNPAEVARSLGDRIFRDPDSGDWHTAEGYLSGNVRAKLLAARAAAAKDTTFEPNVRALEAVQPKDLDPTDIDVRLGAPWVPASDVEDFVQELLGSGSKVKHTALTASWNLELKNRGTIANTEEWGVNGATAEELIHDALNQKATQIVWYDDEGKRHVDVQKTVVAQEKQNEIKERFANWVWEDQERAERLSRFYNDNYNNLRTPAFDGSHLTLPGSSANISLRPTQKNAVWRYLTAGNTLLDHVVGAGKTFTAIASAMEAKRMGLVKKPGFAVPDHMLEQFSREFMQMYPGAKILVATKDQVTSAARRSFIAKAATGNWDAVIMRHTSFEKIGLSAARQAKFVKDEIAQYEAAIKESKGDRVTVKNLEAAKKQRTEKLKALLEAKEKDKGLTFEDTGIDGLFVDESHLFKNLEIATKISNIAPRPSQRAFDMFTKTRYINELTPGRGVMFMTGTPISRSMAEMFTLQRYLAPQALAERNISHFDGWAAQFGDTVVAPEISPDGLTARLKARFARFRNIPELVSMYRQFADFVTTEDLIKSGLVKLPKVKGGSAETKVSAGSPELLAYVQDLAKRAEAIKSGQVPKDVDNMLKISNDGRNAALDMRLVDPGLPPDPARKAVDVANSIAEIHHATTDGRKTQIVFLDRSVPRAGRFSAYNDIKQLLIDRGVPSKEIAFAQDADTDEKKARLFADVRAGKVRVLMGSTNLMGVGTNVQPRLIALHNIDVPWNPADLEQRRGRIERQGNGNDEIMIHNYVTEGSFDAYMWQTLERKARFINQIKNGDPNVRTAGDIDEDALSYAEVKAIASGNPLIMKKAQADADVDRLNRVRNAHTNQQFYLKRLVAGMPERQRAIATRIAALKADEAKLNLSKGDQFEATIAGKRYTKRAEASEALGNEIARLQQQVLLPESGGKTLARSKIAHVGGFDVSLHATPRERITGFQGDKVMTERYGDPAATIHDSRESTLDINPAAPGGALTRVENHLQNISSVRAEAEDSEVRRAKEEADARALIGKPFPREAEYQDALKRQEDIDTKLGLRAPPQNAVEAEPPEAAEGPRFHKGSTTTLEGGAFTEEGREDRRTMAQFGRRGVKRAPEGTRAFRLDDGTVLHLPERPSPEEQRLIDGVRGEVNRLAPSAKVFAARSIEMGKGELKRAGAAEDTGVQGITHIDPQIGRSLIAWSLESSENPKVTSRHEVIHWLRANGFFTRDEWTALERGAVLHGWARDFHIDERYPNAPDWLKTEESVAEAFGHAMDMPKWIPESLRPIFARFVNLLDRIHDLVKRTFGGTPTAHDIFSRIESGEIGGREAGSGERGPLGQGLQTATQAGRVPTPKEKEEISRRQLTAYRDIRKHNQLVKHVDSFHAQGIPLSKSIDALTRGISEAIRGARDSTAQHQISRQNDFTGRLMANLDKLPGGMQAWTKRTHTALWVRELHELNKTQGGKPGVTGNKLALGIAKAVHDAQDMARFRLNKAGAWVGDYDGYIARTLHNATAIHKAGFEPWRDYVMERLDPKTFDDIENDEDIDEKDKDAAIEAWLRSTYDALSTGVHVSSAGGAGLKAGAFPLGFNLGRRVSAERVLHWKDADSWRQYQEKFGDPVIERGVLNSLMRAGRDAPLMDRWGSNPQTGFENLLRKLKVKYRHDHAAIADLNRAEARLREEFSYLTGEAHRPQNDLTTKISGAVRGWQDITKLSYVLFTHMSVGATKPLQLAYHGMGQWKAYSSVLRNLAQDGSPEGKQTLENLWANATGQVQNLITGYEPIDGVPGQVAKLRMIAMRMGGLPWMLARQKAGSMWELSNFLGQKVGQEFEALHPKTQRALQIYGIGKPEWDALRTAPGHDRASGHTFLTPGAAMRARDEAIIGLAGKKYEMAATPEAEARVLEDTRDRLAMKLASYYSDSADRSVVTPGIPERAFFSRHAGKTLGPMVGQYKTWALAAVRQMWGQAWYGSSKAEAVKMLAELVAVGSAMGYARNAIKSVLQGETPEFFDGNWKHDLPLIGKSMLAGGGLGIFGDYLLGQFSSYGKEGKDRALEFIANLAGPVIGDIGSIYGVGSNLIGAPFQDRPGKAFRDTGSEGLRFFLDHVPLINAFYIRTIANWMILDRLQDAANPGYLKRHQEAVKKRTGQESWLPAAGIPPYLGAQSGVQ